MRFVEKALVRPHHCAALPQLGSAHPKGFWDTGNELAGFDNHIYISTVAVEEVARKLDWVCPEDAEVLRNQVDAALGRVQALEADLAEKQRQFDAIDTLESAGHTVRRKRGPKPQLERTAA